MSCSAQLLSRSNRGFVNQALFGSRKEEFRQEKEGVRFLCMECICNCNDVDLKELGPDLRWCLSRIRLFSSKSFFPLLFPFKT